jgi:hypothetical protein
MEGLVGCKVTGKVGKILQSTYGAIDEGAGLDLLDRGSRGSGDRLGGLFGKELGSAGKHRERRNEVVAPLRRDLLTKVYLSISTHDTRY